MNVEHVAQLFGSDAGYRSHIWLEGQRLADAGFAIGEEYTQVWLKDTIVCMKGRIDHFVTTDGSVAKLYHRRVNKQGDHPAIRMEGKRVQDMFGRKFLNVKATFTSGRIAITGNDPVYAESVPKGVQVEHEPEKVAA